MKTQTLSILVVTMLSPIFAARAQSLQPEVLHEFNVGNLLGEVPNRLALARDGSVYGTTALGGDQGVGTVFKLGTNLVFSSLASFPRTGESSGRWPVGLLTDAAGSFYGVSDGSATVFKFDPEGKLSIVTSFSATSGPPQQVTSLLVGADDTLYGTTVFSSYAYAYGGTVFKLAPNGAVTTLVTFDGTNGAFPKALAFGDDGNLYGLTSGAMGDGVYQGTGTVFKVTTRGVLTTLASSPWTTTNSGLGVSPILSLGSDGIFRGSPSFYGSASARLEARGNGYFFQLSTNGMSPPTISLRFTNGGNSWIDQPLTLGSDGNFYGTTGGSGISKYGTVFEITADGKLSTVASFHGNDGAYPGTSLVFGHDGNLYGTTLQGGGGGGGTIFRVVLPKVATDQTSFSQITSGDLVKDLAAATRSVWADFNQDGLLDLFVCGNENRTNLFYLNNGDGTFSKRTQGEPVIDPDYHTGAVVGDIDNDGEPDLLVVAGAFAPSARHPKLFHNLGSAVFEPVSGGDITNQLGYFDACAFADYDRDGFLDLVISDNPSSGNGKTWLYHNNRDGTFVRLPATTIPQVSSGECVLWSDYDNDGYPDLTVVNRIGVGRNYLYHNNRDGTFTRTTTNAIATDVWTTGATCGAWGDYDNDGLPDLFVVGNGNTDRLYHNEGNGRFTKITSGPMLRVGDWGAVWGDYDNDGYLDLFVNYSPGTTGLFHNNGDGTFTEINSEPFLNEMNTLSPALVDFDNDGFLDLFMTRNPLDGTLISNLLYHNNGNMNKWLEVKLVGTVSNRSGIGAKIRVKATINNKSFWQLREINNGGGWNSQPLVGHFGLGNATNIETLRIEWPSGTVQEIQNVAAKQILTVTEPCRLLASSSNGVPQFILHGGRNLQYDIQTSANLTDWSLLSAITITSGDGMALVKDNNALASDHRFYRAVLH